VPRMPRYARPQIPDPSGPHEIVAAGGRDAVIFGAARVLGHAPLARDVPALLQAVKRLKQRRVVDLLGFMQPGHDALMHPGGAPLVH